MSLAVSKSGILAFNKAEEVGQSSRPSEPRPRYLRLPNSYLDKDSTDVKPHGDHSPNSPIHYNAHSKLSFGKRDLLRKDHPSPWGHSFTACKKEAYHKDIMHRVLVTDMQRHGKWNRKLKKEFYDNQTKKLLSSVPHSEQFASVNTPHTWTYLMKKNKEGALGKLVDIVPRRQTGLHLKYGMYTGKFQENVGQEQYILDRKNSAVIDERPRFDNNIKQEIIRENHQLKKWQSATAFDTFRPDHTVPVHTLGYHYTHR